ncbi:MAG: hypothetical protein AB7Q23_15575 [Hyphomonadaceae bacterium]
MRLVIVLLLLGVGAYFTVPARAAHEEAARTLLEARTPTPDLTQDINLDDVIGYVKGAVAGQGRYENWHVASKYSADLAGPEYLECYGAFTLVRCSVMSR